ncbi:maestro heat-like repeat-containing protein family member 7 isoform X1 [Ornithorhynchus anatinus]|uniref:maestro heat-like repeat-containing protein family member 7 isoform X1 n=1 Tax=Ornithorhynchus anatinus TaxID=9258 RepID=UPI0010A88228|nr:maestro heat-like repeat-containing protein family member 7 isoform X1 [Ornithorhynchus anatinus]
MDSGALEKSEKTPEAPGTASRDEGTPPLAWERDSGPKWKSEREGPEGQLPTEASPPEKEAPAGPTASPPADPTASPPAGPTASLRAPKTFRYTENRSDSETSSYNMSDLDVLLSELSLEDFTVFSQSSVKEGTFSSCTSTLSTRKPLEEVLSYVSDSDSDNLNHPYLKDTTPKKSGVLLKSKIELIPEASISQDSMKVLTGSIQDHLNSEQKIHGEAEKLTFLRNLTTLSKTLSWSENSVSFIKNRLEKITKAISMLVKQESLHSLVSTMLQEVFITVTNLSFQNIHLLLTSPGGSSLFSSLTRSIIALPSVKTLRRLESGRCDGPQKTEVLYTQTLLAFCEMLQSLVMSDPHLEKLETILEQLDPWLQSKVDHERERAVISLSLALRCLSRNLSLKPPAQLKRLGHLVALLALLCGDQEEDISLEASESTHHLLRITVHLKYLTFGPKSLLKMRGLMKKCNDLLRIYNTEKFFNNPFQIAEVFEIFLSPKELFQFIMTILNGMKNLKHLCTQETAGRLLEILVKNASTRLEKVPEIVRAICTHLPSIGQHSTRHQVMSLVSLLIAEPKSTNQVLNYLLSHPVPYDRHIAELWRSLEVEETCNAWILWQLLRKLQKCQSTSRNKMAYVAIATTDALYEVFVANKFRPAMYRLFPQLLMTLLIQVHHSIGLKISDVAFPRNMSKRRGFPSNFTPLSCAIQASKAFLIRTCCWHELNTMERERGWDLLEGKNDHLQGVRLLANALLEKNSIFAQRILYLLIPLLNRGNERHKLTSAAFFVELLQSPLSKRLPREYTTGRLGQWLQSENELFRTLGLRGLRNLLCHQRKQVQVEEIKKMLPFISSSLQKRSKREVLFAIDVLRKLLDKMDSRTLSSVINSLLFLLSDVRQDVRLSAVSLLGDSIKVGKGKDKESMKSHVLHTLVPLILHLQDEDVGVAKACRKTLGLSGQLLGWKLPRQVNSPHPWHSHPSAAEKTCQFFEKNCRGKCNILDQSLEFTKSPQFQIRRASSQFIGLVVKNMKPSQLCMKGTDGIEDALSPLLNDHEPSVRIITIQALNRVQKASLCAEPKPESSWRKLFSCVSP